MPKMPTILLTRRTYCDCDRMLQDLTDVVQKQAERRIRSRTIMYVPDIHDSALKNTHSDRRYGKSEESQELKTARDYY